jgi:hypothetical protein
LSLGDQATLAGYARAAVDPKAHAAVCCRSPGGHEFAGGRYVIDTAACKGTGQPYRIRIHAFIEGPATPWAPLRAGEKVAVLTR